MTSDGDGTFRDTAVSPSAVFSDYQEPRNKDGQLTNHSSLFQQSRILEDYKDFTESKGTSNIKNHPNADLFIDSSKKKSKKRISIRKNVEPPMSTNGGWGCCSSKAKK